MPSGTMGTGFLISITARPPRRPPLRVGVDLGDGSGFSFQTLADDNGDGVIHLPLVPVGGRLAIGGTDAGGEVGCDLWDLTGTDLLPESTIQKPLLIIAEDIEGESLGADFGDFVQPPFALTPGTQYTVIRWQHRRLVRAPLRQ